MHIECSLTLANIVADGALARASILPHKPVLKRALCLLPYTWLQQTGRVLVLEGIEKAERNVLPILNNLLENREMRLESGEFLVNPSRYDALLKEHSKEELDSAKLVRVSDNFRVIALGLPVCLGRMMEGWVYSLWILVQQELFDEVSGCSDGETELKISTSSCKLSLRRTPLDSQAGGHALMSSRITPPCMSCTGPSVPWQHLGPAPAFPLPGQGCRVPAVRHAGEQCVCMQAAEALCCDW